jgi:surface antigen
MRLPLRPVAVASAFLGLLAACSDGSDVPTAMAPSSPQRYTAPALPVNGEFIRRTGDATVWMVFNQTLYGIPDEQTLRACTGGNEKVIRQVAALPGWTQRALPSAGNPQSLTRPNNWMFGDNPVKTSTNGTVYLVVGCVKSGVPDQATYNAIFNSDWSRLETLTDGSALDALPTGPNAQSFPLRRAGSLLESNGTIAWVTFRGGSLGVPDPTTMDSYCRGWSEYASGSSEYASYTMNGTLQPGPGPGAGCYRGDEYPYASQPYGIYTSAYVDPWSFYYRQCTSFVAWRLNQNGIKFSNGYKGQHFGNANTWDEAANAAGVRVDHTASRGAVAQWNSGAAGHVAYVASVNTDGTITLEDYNYNVSSNPGTYSRRTVAPSTVENFIHFY